MKNDFLLLTCLPEIISVDNKVYYLQYSDFFTCDVFMITDNGPFYSLASALNKTFSHSELNYQHCLLTVACNTVAISMISEGKFKILILIKEIYMACQTQVENVC